MNTVVVSNKALEDAEYYHGLLPREDLPHLLIDDGDFIVRKSETTPQQPRQIVISLMVGHGAAGIIKHVVVQQNFQGKFCTDFRWSFDSVQDLINHYMDTRESIISFVNFSIAFLPNVIDLPIAGKIFHCLLEVALF